MIVEDLDVAGGPAPIDLSVVLSPDWLSAALSTRYPGVRVAASSVVEHLQTVATKVRFSVSYEDRAGHSLPAGLCVKGYFSGETRSLAIGGREARFYGELAATLPVRVPRCVYAGVDRENGHGVVIMEDLVAAGATFPTALNPYRPDQVAATLEQLAALHASRWNDPATVATAWLDPHFPRFRDAVSDERLEALLADPRGKPLPDPVKQPSRIKAAIGALAERLAERPACIVHCDAHAGNIFEDVEGRPGLIDWQVYQRASWSLDVAYHIAAVLDVPERERSERNLLVHYLECLRAAGVDAPSFDDAWEDYRAALAYGFFMWAITQRVEPAVIYEFNRRLGTAVAAHDSFALLGV